MPEEKEKTQTIGTLLERIGNKDQDLGIVLAHFHEELKRKQDKSDGSGGGGVIMTV